jgi:predicted RNase H-like nuclease
LLNILSQFLISHVLGDRIYSFNVACKLQWIFLCTRKLKYKNKQNQEKRQKIVKEI